MKKPELAAPALLPRAAPADNLSRRLKTDAFNIAVDCASRPALVFGPDGARR
jgi:hypothetical protein